MSEIAQRVPRVSVALVLTTVKLEIERDSKGSVWCRLDGIGAMRKRVGKPQPDLDPCIPLTEYDRARDGARVLLAEICAACPKRCAAKRW